MANIINADNGVLSGTAGLKSSSDGTGILALQTNGTTAVTVDASQNVGIGTALPSGKLNVISGSVAQLIIGFNGTSASYLDSDAIVFRNAATSEAGRFTSTGLFQFNSGYGSSATAYGCRAWVNFNGTGTVAIRASGNVTSITDNGTGDYTVNFTTAITDVNYAVNITTSVQGTSSINGGFMSTLSRNTTPAVGSVRIEMFTSTFANADSLQVNVAIFR